MNKASKKASETPQLTLPVPTQEDWGAMTRDLKLSPGQEQALAMTLEHLSADLAIEQAKRDAAPLPGQLVTRLKRMEAHLAALVEEMDRAKADMIHFLPNATLAEIGRVMTFHSIDAALGGDIVSEQLKKPILARIQERQALSPVEMEEATLSARETLGLKHGDIILRDFLTRIHEPMRQWIEQDKLNAGGKPPQFLRRHVVYALARSAPEIIGRKAAISEIGPFVELCDAVLRALRLSDNGAGKIVPDIVRQFRKDQGIGSGPTPRRKRQSAPRK